MRILLLILNLSLGSCAQAKLFNLEPKERKIWARITYYHGSEDKFGRRVACDKRIVNRQGYGVSAHPDFKFYTKIRIPFLNGVLDKDDEFTVIDRGSAVTSKKASKKKTYVFDVFLNFSGSKFRKFVNSQPPYGWVIIK